MRVAIATVFNEYFNYGSFLQAFALQEYMTNRGIQVDMLYAPSSTRTKRKLRSVVTKNPKRLRFNLIRFFVYTIINRQLNSLRWPTTVKYDAIIAGSDEIWNLKNATFDHLPIYFGQGVDAVRRISYAPSTNGMEEADFSKREFERSALKKIDSLSARDQRTVDLIKKVTERDVVEVLDPTFLLDWGKYEKINTPNCKYILVYCYDLTPDRLIMLQSLAKKLNVDKIISIGHFSDVGVDVVMSDPFEFLGYIKNATAVVSDSFHGTILSIQYHKQFCSFVGKNYKVDYALKSLGLDARNANHYSDIVDIFAQEIDYTKVDEILNVRKKISFDFLNRSLNIQ